MANNYYDNQNAQQAGVQLAHTIAGTPVNGSLGVPSGGDVQLATGYSTAPYRPDRRFSAETKKQLCSEKDCVAYLSQKTAPYCYGHGIKRGLVAHPRTGKKKAVDGDAG